MQCCNFSASSHYYIFTSIHLYRFCAVLDAGVQRACTFFYVKNFISRKEKYFSQKKFPWKIVRLLNPLLLIAAVEMLLIDVMLLVVDATPNEGGKTKILKLKLLKWKIARNLSWCRWIANNARSIYHFFLQQFPFLDRLILDTWMQHLEK